MFFLGGVCSTKRIEVAQKQVAKPKKQDLAKMTPQERRAHAAAERNAKIKQQQEELQREIERLTAAVRMSFLNSASLPACC